MKDGKLGCGGLIAIILLVFAFLMILLRNLERHFNYFFGLELSL